MATMQYKVWTNDAEVGSYTTLKDARMGVLEYLGMNGYEFLGSLHLTAFRLTRHGAKSVFHYEGTEMLEFLRDA